MRRARASHSRRCARDRSAAGRLERFPIAWNHAIDKESLKIKRLEQVLVEKVCQLFRNLL
ncbi:hypothetical protein FEV16_00170 [Methylocystis sp. B8]|nr:hypothetical protein FEV16_00170 [Methylocystis sp. B8]